MKAKVHYGDGKTGTETFDNALVLVPDEVENWLKKILPASIDRSKFKAQQVPSFPIEVIREAVINAIFDSPSERSIREFGDDQRRYIARNAALHVA